METLKKSYYDERYGELFDSIFETSCEMLYTYHVEQIRRLLNGITDPDESMDPIGGKEDES